MYKRTFLLAIALLGIHLLLQCWFWFYNRALFAEVYSREAGLIFFRSLQQDWLSLCIVNLPTILLMALMAWMTRPGIRRPLIFFARAFFIAGNILALALNCIDIGYFSFDRHRANLDIGFVLGDSLSSFKSILAGYWPILLVFALLVIAIVKMAKLLPEPGGERRSSPVSLLLLQLALCAFLLLSTGLPGRPIIPSTPLLSISPRALPLAQNSLLTWIYSCLHRSRELKPVAYFSQEELASIVKTNHNLSPANGAPGFQKKNVVVFILESFSRAYVMPGDPQKAHTPFLDSLIRKSMFFPHSFANGFSSNQGIVAILGGLPALTDEPFFYSPFANTPLYSIGNILKEKGYNTNFLMGAGRDHFGFGKFAHMAGLDHAYWQDDFNDDRFYDGNWGIFDEPFLQYGARILSTKPQPFFATFFTISAHSPFTIPPALRARFDFPDQSPAQRGIAYTDYALQQFFSTCRQMPWFRNTIFVFCADHWFTPDSRTVFSYLNNCTIPIIVYDPAHDTGSIRPQVAGQVDLAPTILDLLGYKGTYSGFGRSLLDTTGSAADRYVINRLYENYQLITNEYILGFDPVQDKSSYLYRYTTDSTLRDNLLADTGSSAVRHRLERLIRANIQAYSQALTRRSLE